jgi:hypothetical protein
MENLATLLLFLTGILDLYIVFKEGKFLLTPPTCRACPDEWREGDVRFYSDRGGIK